MKRIVAGFVALAAALLVQLTILNGLRLPGGGVPDLVLLCVVGLGMTGGPRWGIVAGFWAGLALDLAPPADQVAGQYALVLCLAGYAAGRLRVTLRFSALASLAAAGVVAVAAEIFAAVLTLALDTPQLTVATAARLLPSAALYDLLLMPVVLLVTVRSAVALGVSLDPLDDSPALERGGSAAPGTVAGVHGSAPRVRPRQAGQRLAVGGDRRAAASGRWLVGDVGEAAPTVGAIGWLGEPARTRRARRKQARLIATLTGASPRKGPFWVGARPPGLTPAIPSHSGSAGLARLRPGAGVAGSAAPGARPAPVAGRLAGAGPVRLGLAEEQRRRSKAAARSRRATRGTGMGTGGLDHGLDRHGVGGPGLPAIAFGTGSLPAADRNPRRRVPKIAFGSGGLPAAGRGPRRRVPKIAFGSGGMPGAARPARHEVPRIGFGSGGVAAAGRGARPKVPKIAFGSGGVPAAARPARPKEARIAFGSGRVPGAARAARPKVPRIAFGTGSLAGAGRAAGRPVPKIAFGSTASTVAGHGGQAGAGARRPSQPHFARPSARRVVRPRQVKTARFTAGRRRHRLLPWLQAAGGRSTVWRIASSRGPSLTIESHR